MGGKSGGTSTPKENAPPSTFTPYGENVYVGQPGQEGYANIVSLSPEEQKLYEGRTGVAQSMIGRADKGLSGMPTSFSFDGATDPATNRYWAAQKALLDKSFAMQEDQLGQRLVNQGIPMGSKAYEHEMDQFRQSRSDAERTASADALNMGYSQALGTRQQNVNEVAQALTAAGGQGTQIGQIGGVDPGTAYAGQQAATNRAFQNDVANSNNQTASQNTAMAAGATVLAAYL